MLWIENKSLKYVGGGLCFDCVFDWVFSSELGKACVGMMSSGLSGFQSARGDMQQVWRNSVRNFLTLV
jgi:hypothetical protein